MDKIDQQQLNEIEQCFYEQCKKCKMSSTI